MYSKEVREYFKNPINMGIIKDANGIGVTENEICSDIIKIYIKVNTNNIIKDIKFEAKGCQPVIASCCELTSLVKYMKIEEALQINAKLIIGNLGRLPNEKEHCAELVVKTFKKAILNFEESNKYINFDDINTWGIEITSLLSKLCKMNERYDKNWGNKKIEEQLREWPKIKEYIEEKRKTIDKIKDILQDKKIICWHCTRLTNGDYISIKRHGLNVLTKEMQICRIRQLYIAENDKKILIREIKKKDFSTRIGQIHFVFSEQKIDS